MPYRKKCPCGCGDRLNGRQTYAHGSTCRYTYHKKLLAAGKLKPVTYGRCQHPRCGKRFPRYKEFEYSMKKRYCSPSCGVSHSHMLKPRDYSYIKSKNDAGNDEWKALQ